MARKGRVAKRDVLPDPVYNSKTVTKLINNIMLDGKKGVAQNILYEAFKKVEEKTNNTNHLKKKKKKLEIQQWKFLIKQSITLCQFLNLKLDVLVELTTKYQ